MKASSMLFAAVLALGVNSYAIYLPGNGKTPVYFCQTTDTQARVFHQNGTGQAFLKVEHVQADQTIQTVLEQEVTELTNKTQTVYTSDNLMLKIQHHPSGQMPGVMFVSQEPAPQEIKLNCQTVYSIMEEPSEM